MTTTTIIIGLAIGFGVAAILWMLRGREADAMGVLLIAGLAALAAVVTVVRVQQYRDQQATIAAANPTVAAATPSEGPSGPPPLTNGPPREPINIPVMGPGLHPATGAAAPAAVPNPYAGG